MTNVLNIAYIVWLIILRQLLINILKFKKVIEKIILLKMKKYIPIDFKCTLSWFPTQIFIFQFLNIHHISIFTNWPKCKLRTLLPNYLEYSPIIDNILGSHTRKWMEMEYRSMKQTSRLIPWTNKEGIFYCFLGYLANKTKGI